ncbi:NACHT and WD repeat domain-containing protein, partial [Frankia canadensis]|uniref:NACHT and WD repeat domain-containing protein n=1 Tax=Frankia canadensis TaxID=1836972 RepID=UPI001FAF87F2
MSAANGQAIGVNYGQILQQRFSGPFALLRDATIPLDPLPGDLRLYDPATPDNPVARFRGRTDLIRKIDAFISRSIQMRRGGYLLIEAEAGMGKSALATYLAFTRGWPAHFTRLADGRTPEAARLNLAAQLIATWRLNAAPGGILPAGADTPRWLYQRLCDAAKIRDTTAPGRPVVCLVDGLDEAPPATSPGELPLGLPPALPPGTVIIATTRPSTVTFPAGSRTVERIDVESEFNRQDLLDYLTMVSTRDPLIADALCRSGMSVRRFSQTLLIRSDGVWIYALTVLDQIRDRDRDPNDVDELPHGLAGYYADNIHRWQTALGDHAWQTRGLPLLATLTATREAQPAATLACWADVPEPDTRKLLHGVFRPFLAVRQGGDPDLYLPRHQSLRDFTAGTTLTDSDHDGVRHLGYTLAAATRAAHTRITTALTPVEPVGQRRWAATGAYALAYLPEHAAHAGLLSDFLHDPEFISHVGFRTVLHQRRHLTTATAHAFFGAFDLAVGHHTTERLAVIEVSARKTGANSLADSVARRLPSRLWRPIHAIWNGPSHNILTHRGSPVVSLATVSLPDGRTLLATADGETVQLWDPARCQAVGPRLTGHIGTVLALAGLSLPDGRTLLATGGDDETVRLWDPAS